jgi:Spx/MgsR family transcriptional regulator
MWHRARSMPAKMRAVKLYLKSTCTSCRDARRWLRDHAITVEEIDYAKRPLTEAMVTDLVERAGGVAPVLNTRHATAKANGWVTAPPASAAFARAVVAEVNLLRRPILVTDSGLIVGFDRAAYGAL